MTTADIIAAVILAVLSGGFAAVCFAALFRDIHSGFSAGAVVAVVVWFAQIIRPQDKPSRHEITIRPAAKIEDNHTVILVTDLTRDQWKRIYEIARFGKLTYNHYGLLNSDIRKLRLELIRRGFASWGRGDTVEINQQGMEFLAKAAGEKPPPPPLPPDEGWKRL